MDFKQHIATIPNFPKDGINFRDMSPILAEPEIRDEVVKVICNEWRDKVDLITALDARGFIFGSIIADKLGIPFVMVRKAGKLPGDTVQESYKLEYGEATIEIQNNVSAYKGKRALIVDDLLATGGTALAACSLLQKLELEIAGCTFLIELSDLQGREKLEQEDVYVHSLMKFTEDE